MIRSACDDIFQDLLGIEADIAPPMPQCAISSNCQTVARTRRYSVSLVEYWPPKNCFVAEAVTPKRAVYVAASSHDSAILPQQYGMAGMGLDGDHLACNRDECVGWFQLSVTILPSVRKSLNEESAIARLERLSQADRQVQRSLGRTGWCFTRCSLVLAGQSWSGEGARIGAAAGAGVGFVLGLGASTVGYNKSVSQCMEQRGYVRRL